MKSDFPDAKHILIDEHFRSTQDEVRNALLNADEGAEVVFELQGSPQWGSLATAFAGTSAARVESVLLNPRGEDWEAKIRTGPSASSSWLLLSFDPSGFNAQVYAVGAKETLPAARLGFDPNAMRAYLAANCSRRCESV
jgi:hypothetical protein